MTQEKVCGHQRLSALKLAHNSQVRVCSASIYNHRTSTRKCVLEETLKKKIRKYLLKKMNRKTKGAYIFFFGAGRNGMLLGLNHLEGRKEKKHLSVFLTHVQRK